MTNFQQDKYTKKALSLAREGGSFFITGNAGTGKTMLLREMVEEGRSHGRRVAVCAPTGVAAKNAGGVTIHSLLKVPISFYIPGHTVKQLYSLSFAEQQVVEMLDLLIIDEVSMVRCDLLDMVDAILRHYRHDDRPFGGLQVILFGDLRQLMPVAREEDWEELGKYYKAPYFFCSDVIRKMNMPMLELTKVHRQTDTQFISMLNDIREGMLTEEDERTLGTRYKKDFDPVDSQNYIRLTTHNWKAEKYNASKLKSLRGSEQEYKAYIKGYYPKDDWPADCVLHLKKGARVMFIANDNEFGRYVNGTLGMVESTDETNIRVLTDEGVMIDVEKSTWEYFHYEVDRESKEVKRTLMGSFHQYPLRLAWAVTIHKSQGLTFDKVVIDAGKAFTYGQVYVALSRCRTLNGIVLATRITPDVVMSDPLVQEYMQLVEHIWPDDEAEEVVEDDAEDIIEGLDGYEPVGHVFRAPWDGLLYDAWEDASQKYYVDKLVVKDGVWHRLCVGIIADSRPLFEVLINREYHRIKSWKHLGGTSSVIEVMMDDEMERLNFRGNKCYGQGTDAAEGAEKWDVTPHLRSYEVIRTKDTLRIWKSSNNTFPSEMKTYSDMGKLLLCCDRHKILRNDSREYCVAVEDGSYRVYHYSLDGKALDEDSKMVSDKWYQKNGDRAKITKTYETIPETRSEIKPARRKAAKKKPAAAAKRVKASPFARYEAGSLERQILECMKNDRCQKARDIAKAIGATRKEVNSTLYGTLSTDGLVVVNDSSNWMIRE